MQIKLGLLTAGGSLCFGSVETSTTLGTTVTDAGVPESIPPSLARLVARALPTEQRTSSLWRIVEAEIVPDFKHDFDDPLYLRWINFRVQHAAATAHGLPRDQAAHPLMPLVIMLQSDVRGKADELATSEQRSRFTDLQVEIERVSAIWAADSYTTRIDHPSPRAQQLLHEVRDELKQRLKPSNAAARTDRPRKKRPPGNQLFDRLPSGLIAFVKAGFPDLPRDPQFWNRLREYVFPHFVAEALGDQHYRQFLRLAIRRYGFRQTDSVLKDARQQSEATSAIQRSTSDLRTPHLELALTKLETLVESLQGEEARGWLYPPLASPGTLPDSPGCQRS